MTKYNGKELFEIILYNLNIRIFDAIKIFLRLATMTWNQPICVVVCVRLPQLKETADCIVGREI